MTIPSDLSDIEILAAQIKTCRRCARLGFPIGEAPLVRYKDAPLICPAPVMVVGQAPSRTDNELGLTYQGPAAKRLISWLEKAGIRRGEIGSAVYMTALTKCFPGRLPGKSTDRPPSQAELTACAPWLEKELELVKPRLIIPMGKMAIDRLLKPSLPLDKRIGLKFEWNGAVVIPLPHSSGAGVWLNSAENQMLLAKAIELIGIEFAALDLT